MLEKLFSDRKHQNIKTFSGRRMNYLYILNDEFNEEFNQKFKKEFDLDIHRQNT